MSIQAIPPETLNYCFAFLVNTESLNALALVCKIFLTCPVISQHVKKRTSNIIELKKIIEFCSNDSTYKNRYKVINFNGNSAALHFECRRLHSCEHYVKTFHRISRHLTAEGVKASLCISGKQQKRLLREKKDWELDMSYITKKKPQYVINMHGMVIKGINTKIKGMQQTECYEQGNKKVVRLKNISLKYFQKYVLQSEDSSEEKENDGSTFSRSRSSLDQPSSRTSKEEFRRRRSLDRHSPRTNKDETRIHRSLDRHSPRTNKEETSIHRSLDRHSPRTSKDETRIHRSLDRHSPRTGKEETRIHRSLDRNSPRSSLEETISH